MAIFKRSHHFQGPSFWVFGCFSFQGCTDPKIPPPMPFGLPPFSQFGRLKSTGGARLHRWASAAAGWWKSQGKRVFQGAELEAGSWLWSWLWLTRGWIFLEGYSDPTKKQEHQKQVSTKRLWRQFFSVGISQEVVVVENRMEIHSTFATLW